MKHGMIVAAQPEAAEAGAEVAGGGRKRRRRRGRDGADADRRRSADVRDRRVRLHACVRSEAGAARDHRLLRPRPRRGHARHVGGEARRRIRRRVRVLLSDRSNELGYGAIATPVTLRGLDAALKRHGTKAHGDLIGPAIRYARDGVMVRPHMAAYWGQVPTESRAPHQDFLSAIPATRKIYTKPDGAVRKVGEVLKNPDMARTLSRIATAGADDFFEAPSRPRSRRT